MIFSKTKLKGIFVIEPEKLVDERGFFARTWCQREFREQGLNLQWVQCNISFNKKKGTLRGMHYQAPPRAEDKLVRCTKGAIYDIALDLRSESPTFGQWFAVELTAENHRMLYIPKGFAHGFQTLQDDTEVFYQMSEFYYPENAHGIRWNDPAFEIEWPISDKVISKKDASLELWQDTKLI